MAIRLMPELSCSGCTKQEELGCDAFQFRTPEGNEDPKDTWHNPAHMPITLDGEDTFACPRQTLHEDPDSWASILKYYGFYGKGFLPQTGSIIDQSNSLMDTFRVLDTANAECDDAKQEQQSRPKGDPSNRR